MSDRVSEIFKIELDLNYYLEEIKKNSKDAYEYLTNSNTDYDEETITYGLLDVEESVEVVEKLIEILEDKYENRDIE